jgi:hypothetical protein
MRGRGLLLIGAIAGLVFAATPQGRTVIDDVKHKAADAWGRPDVQRRVGDVEQQVRKNVPVVGDDIADAINRVRPTPGPLG